MNVYSDKICEAICGVLCERTPDEKTSEDFVDLLDSLFTESNRPKVTIELANAIKITLERFVENERICTAFLKSISRDLSEDEGILSNLL